MTATQKKQRKMLSSFTILFLITVFVAVLSWIVPAGQYDLDGNNYIAGTYHVVDATRQGIWDVLTAPITGMIGNDATPGAIEVALFVMVVGGFLGVVTATGAIDAGIASVIRNNRDNVGALIWGLMFIFALGGATYGMAEETMAFYPLLIPIMIAVGMDSLVAVAVVLVGSGLGVLSSIVNPFATSIASDIAGITVVDGMVLRLIFFVTTYFIGAWYVSSYAKKVQSDPKNSLIYDKLDEQREKFKVDENIPAVTGRQKAVLVLFALTFIIMILGLIPWADVLKVEESIFDSIHNALQATPFIKDLMGQSALALGHWYLIEITMLFFFMSIVIAIVYGLSEEKYIKSFLDGMADLLGVAIICAVARGIQVVMNGGQITATILHWGEDALGGLSQTVFIILTYLFYIPMSFLIPSTSGLAAATMGIMAPLGDFANVSKSLIITAYQAASGVVNLLTPTSGVVMGALAIADIELTTWWKFMRNLTVIVVILSIVLLVGGAMFHL